MAGEIRLLEPGTVYAVVQTTVDRTFAFVPNHEPGAPLLAVWCPPSLACELRRDHRRSSITP